MRKFEIVEIISEEDLEEKDWKSDLTKVISKLKAELTEEEIKFIITHFEEFIWTDDSTINKLSEVKK